MGPIERAGNIIPRLTAPVKADSNAVREGTLLIASGLIKKMVIGDYLNHHLVMNIFSAPERFTGIENLAAIFGYSMVIYCDFSGYTDIARGIARWAGFNPALNFNLPYKSRNIGEFWRRWHISLSSWLRDYLFMPVALKLSGWLKRDYLFNIPLLKTEQVIFWIASIVTFFICGIWHGTGTNFIIWGLMHGLALSVQKSWNQATRNFRKKQNPAWRKLNQRLGIILTFSFVSAGWVFFRMETPAEVLLVFNQVFLQFSAGSLPAFLVAYRLPLLMLVAAYTWHLIPDNLLARGKRWLMQSHFLTILAFSIILIIVIFYFQKLGSSQPIYIRF
jgi:D-alanyl-lipoteichoic acid acyltransferase DltB (MBOAT superfamily)